MTTPGSFTTQTSDMIAVHRALVEALEAAPDLVGGAGDDGERVEVIASYYENVLEFLHVHHTGEDELIYPILEERCAEHKEVLKEIDAQHSLLNDPMNEARMAIATWRASPSVEGGHEVISLIGTIDAVLRPHLDDEETTVLPIASAWISQDEWAKTSWTRAAVLQRRQALVGAGPCPRAPHRGTEGPDALGYAPAAADCLDRTVGASLHRVHHPSPSLAGQPRLAERSTAISHQSVQFRCTFRR